MKKITLTLMTIVLTSFFAACGGSGTGNTANKPANAANANAAAAPADPKAAEAEIRKLMDAGQAALAKNDADALDKIYADNHMFVNIDGSVQNKAERLAAFRSGETKYTSFAYSEADIRVNAEATGAVAISRVSLKGTAKGKPIDGEYRVTQVYSKLKDGWKQVSASATKIEGGAAKPDDKAKTANTPKTGDPKIDALATDDGGAPPPAKKK